MSSSITRRKWEVSVSPVSGFKNIISISCISYDLRCDLFYELKKVMEREFGVRRLNRGQSAIIALS